MSVLVPVRVTVHEHLDAGDGDAAEVERSLRDLRRFNSYCGGHQAFRRMLNRLAPDRRISILDLGTGTSDLLEALPRSRHALRVGLDFRIEHLLYGRRTGKREITRVVGDARKLPFRSESIDAVTSSHFFHHFTPDENRGVITEALRVARVGVAFTDTRRHLAPWLFTKVLGWLHLVGAITRFDAPASVRQGYTPQEAAQCAAGTNAARSAVIRLFPFRFGLLLWKR